MHICVSPSQKFASWVFALCLVFRLSSGFTLRPSSVFYLRSGITCKICASRLPTLIGINPERPCAVRLRSEHDKHFASSHQAARRQFINTVSSSLFSKPIKAASGIVRTARENLARNTRWIVAGTSAVAVLWRQDAVSYTMLLGAVSNGLLSKVLKSILKQERPEGAPVSDPGMPSSHAMTLFFLASYLCSAAAVWTPWPPAYKVGACLAMSGFALNSVVWRVSAGYHTRDQVVVGSILGGAHGLGWFALTAAHPATLAAWDAVVRRRPLVAVGVSVLAVCWPSVLGVIERRLFGVDRHAPRPRPAGAPGPEPQE